MTKRFKVPDASCGHCKATIEKAVSTVLGVTGASLDLASKELTVEHEEAIDDSQLRAAIVDAGYTFQV